VAAAEPLSVLVAPVEAVLVFVAALACAGLVVAAVELLGAAGWTVTTVSLVVTVPLPQPSTSAPSTSAIANQMNSLSNSSS
jgi:hypothetical protein